MILHMKLESGCYVNFEVNCFGFFFFGEGGWCLDIWGLEHGTVFVQESENTVKIPYSAIMQHTCVSKEHIVNLILWASDM